MAETRRVSIGRDEAIRLAESGWWKGKTPREICDVQLFTEELCMDFSDFHGAFEKAVGRPVWTHEFGLDYDGLVREYLGERPAPTMADIIGLLPADKTVVVAAD